MSRCAAKFGHPAWARRRELGQRSFLGHADTFYKGLYSSILPYDFQNETIFASNRVPGAVYSLDFSPDGSLLVAGCEKSCIAMFDPLHQKKIEVLNNPQMGCVFNVKFLDSWTFASGSEDCIVALWDVRNLKQRVRTLFGHLWSVRNIEYSSKSDILVSSGIDGTTLLWNLHNKTGRVRPKEFGSLDFCRLRLHPDASKLIISSTEGYLLIVHDLDLNKVSEDLAGFYPGIRPLWDLNQSPSRLREPAFSRNRKRNRVEPVVDFPHADRPSMVSALEIHPQGWSALSLSWSIGKKLEWVCAHDIQDTEPPARRAALQTGSDDSSSSAASGMPSNENVEKHIRRLTHYAEKKIDVDDILFKEFSLSPDGRIICHPSGNCIILHSFSPFCDEQFVSWSGGEPSVLHEISTFNCSNVVYSARFSPHHYLLVSGCVDGGVHWYQPVL